MSETCYMCDARATSREHAPPSCLFPEEKLIGRNLRRNLITVPSCDLHNSVKSEDDEFLRAALCLSAADVSYVARQNFCGKVLRGARRAPTKYGAFAPKANVLVPIGKSAFKADRERFDRCVASIASAIFFHTFGTRWRHSFAIASPQLQTRSNDGRLAAHTPSLAAIEATRNFLATEPVKGENPEVFLYRIRVESEMLAFAAIFYEHFEVFAVSSATLAADLD